MSSFISPLTTNAQMRYGGSLENRCAIVGSLLRDARRLAQEPAHERAHLRHDWVPGG